MSNSIEEAKKIVVDACHQFVNSSLAAGTWGNISCRIDDTYFACTPSGRDYNELTVSDIPIVNMHDLTYQGLKPTKEKNFHSLIYKNRKDVNAIIHTHSQYASTVAAARVDLPPVLDDQAQILGINVRCANYALPGSKKIAKEVIKSLKGRMAVLLANHGAVVVGKDMANAFIGCEVLEKACIAFISAEFIGGAVPLKKFDARVMHWYFVKKYQPRREENK